MVAAGLRVGGRGRGGRVRFPRRASVLASTPSLCHACGHPVGDHPGAGAVVACAACTWQADLGLIEPALLCRLSYDGVQVSSVGREGRRGDGVAAAVKEEAGWDALSSALRARHGSVVEELSDDAIVEEVVSRLSATQRQLDAADLARRVRDCLGTTFAGARIRNFLPVLIERQLTTQLGLAAGA